MGEDTRKEKGSFFFRVSKSEEAAIKHNIGLSGLEKGVYLKTMAIHGEITVRDFSWIEKIDRISSTLNEILKQCREDGIPEDVIEKLKTNYDSLFSIIYNNITNG